MKRLTVMLTFLAGWAHAEPPQILTDIAPVHSLVAQVMGDLGEPSLLLEATDDVHHMQLRPSQAKSLADAQVVFWVGPVLEPWLVGPMITLSEGATTVALVEGAGHGGHDDGDTDHDHKATDEHKGHAHGAHPWLDPMAASDWLDTIAATLADANPENRETYMANAAEAQENLAALTVEIQQNLSPLTGSKYVVGHDAYGAFADRFGLTILASLRDGEDSEPGAARIAQIQDLVKSGEVACIFADAGHSDALARVVNPEGTVPLGELDPIGTNLAPGPQMYGSLISALAQSFANCQ